MAKKTDPTKIRHLGTFRETCAQNDCSGCPDLKTKKANYLLRSTRQDELLNLMALVHVARVKLDATGLATVVKAGGAWAGTCNWGVEVLESRGLIRLDNTRFFELTALGHAALEGALTALGRRIDTQVLLARIDAGEIY